jgi:hypothetical protein
VRRPLYFVTLFVLLVGFAVMPGRASSHREAPLIGGDPQADNTDLYAFMAPNNPDLVTIIASYIPFEDPMGGPNFYRFGDDVLYEIKIDNNGDAVEDITYQFRFKSFVRNPNTFLYNTGPMRSAYDPTRNMFQTYTVTRVDNGRVTQQTGQLQTMFDNTGFASVPDYNAITGQAAGIHDGGPQGRVFAGQTDDPFFLDLRVFDLLYGANLSEAGTDSLAGFNVHSIALQVPKALLKGSGPVLGIWATASRPTTTTRQAGSETSTGAMVQVSRLGMPLVNEVVIPVGQKDKWNGSRPADDGQFGSYVLDPEVPKLLQGIYNIPAPATPRNDLVQVFLTGVPGLNQPAGVRASEMLRLNTDIAPVASPSRMGVFGNDTAGFPNGRRLTDDVIDITLQAAAGFLVGQNTGLGDGVDKNDLPFRSTFPYLAVPHSGGNAWKLNPNPAR